MQDAGPVFQALVAQLIWITPVFLVWKIASSVGILHTLGTDGSRSFWQGVGEYTPRGLLVGLLFLVPLVVFLVGFAIVAGVLSWAFPGEVASFWIRLTVLPIFLILGIALLDQMHDYARMALVIGHRPVVESFLSGLKFPFQFGLSSTIYIIWFVVGASILILPTLIAQWMGGLWVVFLIQQVVLFVRAGVSVGWFASEHALYEAAIAPPAIAENTYAASPASTVETSPGSTPATPPGSTNDTSSGSDDEKA